MCSDDQPVLSTRNRTVSQHHTPRVLIVHLFLPCFFLRSLCRAWDSAPRVWRPHPTCFHPVTATLLRALWPTHHTPTQKEVVLVHVELAGSLQDFGTHVKTEQELVALKEGTAGIPRGGQGSWRQRDTGETPTWTRIV